MTEPLSDVVLAGTRSTMRKSFDVVGLPGPVEATGKLPFRDQAHGISGVPRDGWVAFVRRSTVAVRNGDLTSARLIAEAPVVPAFHPALVISEGPPFRLLDADGTVQRELHPPERVQMPDGRWSPIKYLVGQLANDNLVWPDGVITWDGELATFREGLRAEAVLAGRWIVLLGSGRLVIRDVQTGAQQSTACPHTDDVWIGGPNPSLTAAVWLPHRARQQLPMWVARAGEVPFTIDHGIDMPGLCWLDDHRLLVVGDRRGAVHVDIDSRHVTPTESLPGWFRPTLDLTGRFSPEQFEDAPTKRRRQAGPTEVPVPTETLEAMAQAPGDGLVLSGHEAGQMRFGHAPQRMTLAVTSKDQAWATDDPHADESGCYEVVADSLIVEADDFDSDGLFVWLPLEGCFGAWDPDHENVVALPGVAWADVVADPGTYLDASLTPPPGSKQLVPVGRHPFQPG